MEIRGITVVFTICVVSACSPERADLGYPHHLLLGSTQHISNQTWTMQAALKTRLNIQ